MVNSPTIAFQASSRSTPSRSLVFIDAGVEDHQQLINGVRSGLDVFVLDPAQDGIAQITAALRDRTDVETVHIVSHGAPGCLFLGSAQLSLETLDYYAWDLQSWFPHASRFTPPALFLYGCNVAAGDAGAELIAHLQQQTGAQIAASTHSVGSSELGGSWELESRTGEVQADLAFEPEVLAAYRALLGVVLYDPTVAPDPLSLDFLTYAQIPLSPITVTDVTTSGSGFSTVVTLKLYDNIAAFPQSTSASGVQLNTDGSIFFDAANPAPGYTYSIPLFGPRTLTATGTTYAADFGAGKSDEEKSRTGYAGFSNHRSEPEIELSSLADLNNLTLTELAALNNLTLVPVNETNPPILDADKGFTLVFNVDIDFESSGSNRAGFSITVISSDGSQGIELGFKEGGDGADWVFAQGANFDNTNENSSAVPLEISETTEYRLTVKRDAYWLSADGVPILNGWLRSYNFDPASSDPPLPEDANPYKTPNFIFLGDNTDQGYAAFTLGKVSVLPYLVISEIMADPASGPDSTWEWIEVYNPGSTTVDLTGYVLDDDDGSLLATGNISSSTIAPGETAILFNADAVNADDFTRAWGPGINLIPVTNWSSLESSDRLALWDSVSAYSSRNFSTTIADVNYSGAGFPVGSGASIYLTNLEADSSLGSNWAVSTAGGATPAGTGYQSNPNGGNSGNDIGSPGGQGPGGIFGTPSIDNLIGTANPDLVVGLASDDVIRSGNGNDRIYGEEGSDRLLGEGGSDTISGGNGSDWLQGDIGDDTLSGEEGNDRLYGGAGSDQLLGGAGFDLLVGGADNDILDGGADSDRLSGQGGSDIFVLRVGDGSDLIYDFENGTDFLGLAGDLRFGRLNITQNGPNTEIRFISTSELLATLVNVTAADITPDDVVSI